MKKTLQQLNYNTKSQTYQLILPLDVEIKVDADESVRTLIEVTERMDYSLLNSAYKRLPRWCEATPKQMFQLVILGFMLGDYSTRKLESACKNDIRFMYILRGKPAPDHNRFWKFIKERLQGDVAENLFYQLVTMLGEMGEVGFDNIFINGTKIEANANRYSFVWKKSINKYETNLDVKITEFINRITNEYGLLMGHSTKLSDYHNTLLEKAKDIKFVYGRGKRKTQIQKDIETLREYIERKDKYQLYNNTFDGRNSFSKTDNDATFMRMKDDHMKNGQLKPGYNLQLGTEGEYIVGVDISSERSDQLTLIPFLERLKSNKQPKFTNILADAGYESEENYKYLKSENQKAYIKPQNYEKSKTRKYKSNEFLRENMPYNAETDTYICPNENVFSFAYTTKKTSVSGFESKVTVYECSGCNECSKKQDCTRAKDNRKLTVSKDFLALRNEAKELITSDTGKRLRVNRSIQSEGVFGVLKQDYGFRRYLRRSKTGVFTETLLYAFAYNINKFHNKKLKKVKGVILHSLNSA